MSLQLKRIFSRANNENAIPMARLQKWGDQVFGIETADLEPEEEYSA